MLVKFNVASQLTWSNFGSVDVKKDLSEADGLCLTLSLDWGKQNNW